MIFKNNFIFKNEEKHKINKYYIVEVNSQQ